MNSILTIGGCSFVTFCTALALLEVRDQLEKVVMDVQEGNGHLGPSAFS